MERRIDISNGTISFGRALVRNMVQQADDGSYMIILEPYEEKKTYQQIKFIHGPVVKAYADYTGEPYADAKFNLKKRFGINRLVRDTQSGGSQLEVRSLKDYSKKQMQTFLDRVLHHLEYECNFIIDAETRSKFKIDELTGELNEI